MSANTRATLMRYDASVCLLLALSMISYITICDGSLSKNVGISRVDDATGPETTIPQGTLRGINMTTYYNRTIFSFIGIPYAQPPVGDLRFKAPVSPDPWNGTLEASSDTESCPQFDDDGELAGNEDCLHLNVFTPQLPSTDDENSTLLPVMLYVIGGGFEGENNTVERFPPDFLLEEDVVLIVPNYRTGVLGFLSTGDEVSPGNYGLKDIVRALEWVRENIQYFGGDPNRVTIFGGSSGAMSVHLLALSNLTDGLIHRYITQSGSAFASTVNNPREASAKRAFELGEYLGCPTNTSTLLIDCLRGLNASQLVDTQSAFYVWESYPNNVWLPTTEPDVEGALLTDTPANLYAAGKVRDLPWIATVTRDEGLMVSIPFYENPDLFEDFLNNIDLALPYVLNYHNLFDDVTPYTDALKAYYLNDLTANRSILLSNFTDLASDGLFVYTLYDAVRKQSALAENPQYFGSFEYRGTFSYSYFFSGGSTQYTTAVHGDELLYLFGAQSGRFGFAPSDAEYSEADLVMLDTMVQLWTSFASDGTPSTQDSVSTTAWQQYSTSLNNYLRIGNGTDPALEVQYNLFAERMQFWDELSSATITSGEFRRPVSALSIVLCICLLSYVM